MENCDRRIIELVWLVRLVFDCNCKKNWVSVSLIELDALLPTDDRRHSTKKIKTNKFIHVQLNLTCVDVFSPSHSYFFCTHRTIISSCSTTTGIDCATAAEANLEARRQCEWKFYYDPQLFLRLALRRALCFAQKSRSQQSDDAKLN